MSMGEEKNSIVPDYRVKISPDFIGAFWFIGHCPNKNRFPVIDLANPSLYICLFVTWDSLFKTFKQTEPLFKGQMRWGSIQWKVQIL